MATLESSYQSIAQGRHGDPFEILGAHGARKNWTVRSWQPQAQRVELLDANDELLAKMKPVHDDGLFEARLPLPIIPYRLRLYENGHSHIIDDPYRFASPFGDLHEHASVAGGVGWQTAGDPSMPHGLECRRPAPRHRLPHGKGGLLEWVLTEIVYLAKFTSKPFR